MGAASADDGCSTPAEALLREFGIDVMETGPKTVRPAEPAEALLDRMERRNVSAVVVTPNEVSSPASPDGEIFGA